MKRTIFFDLDGTLAVWHTVSSITELQKKGYFYNLEPTILTKFANRLATHKGVETVVLSHYLPDTYALNDKNRWCDVHVPKISRDRRLYVPCGVSKAEFIREMLKRPLTEDDILVDDFSKNLIEWEKAGGKAIKWLNGMNGTGGTFTGTRVRHIPELYNIICQEQ